MSFINIFKIERSKFDGLKTKLEELCCNSHEKDYAFDGMTYHTVLYVKNDTYTSRVKWQWILDEFSVSEIKKEKQAWSVMLAEVGGVCYALTFGNAFYHIDKFADKDFAFSIGKKFRYKQIKSTAQANPDSNRNKTIISYLKSNGLQLESGESFIKIKGNIELDEGSALFKENIEIGSSVKLDVEDLTVEKCLRILLKLNELAAGKDVTKIPIFVQVKDKNLLEELEFHLKEEFRKGHFSITFSDFDIIGTQEIFYSTSQTYIIKYERFRKSVDTINESVLRDFCEEKKLDVSEVALSLRIVAQAENITHEYGIKDLIDYTYEEKNCVLLKGEWYRYNADYLEELDRSMDEFEVPEDPTFDWTAEQYQEFLSQKYEEEKDSEPYKGKAKDAVLEKLKKVYYRERAYNMHMVSDHKYALWDRDLADVQGQKVEVADLYFDECLYAVKIGNASSKLCYAVDQIDVSAKGVKRGVIPFDEPVRKVAVLLVLERKDRLPSEDGKIQLRKLKLLVLKNRLNEWKSEMRHLGLEPKVYIGYYSES